MASKKDKEQPRIFQCTADPNGVQPAMFPDHIGDLAVDVTNKKIYFAYGLTSGKWGTITCS